MLRGHHSKSCEHGVVRAGLSHAALGAHQRPGGLATGREDGTKGNQTDCVALWLLVRWDSRAEEWELGEGVEESVGFGCPLASWTGCWSWRRRGVCLHVAPVDGNRGREWRLKLKLTSTRPPPLHPIWKENWVHSGQDLKMKTSPQFSRAPRSNLNSSWTGNSCEAWEGGSRRDSGYIQSGADTGCGHQVQGGGTGLIGPQWRNQ